MPNWQQHLTQYLAEINGQPFEWGKLDCALFIADSVIAMTGHDIAADVRGYSSQKEGLRLVRSKGCHDHVDYISRQFTEVHPVFSMPGDILLTPDNALGISQGALIYQMGLNGLSISPRSSAIKAFTV